MQWADDAASQGGLRRLAGRVGLSGRLLLLTVVFVLIAEVLIYVPSVASYRRSWLSDRVAAAQVAALVLDAAPQQRVSDDLAKRLLMGVGAQAIALKAGGARRLLNLTPMPPEVGETVDLRDSGWIDSIGGAWRTLTRTNPLPLRVVGHGMDGVDFVELVLDPAPLRRAMIAFSGRILVASLVISGITAGLVFLVLQLSIVRPVRRLARNIATFAEDPRTCRGGSPVLAQRRDRRRRDGARPDGDHPVGRIAPEAAPGRSRPLGEQDQPRTEKSPHHRPAPRRPAGARRRSGRAARGAPPRRDPRPGDPLLRGDAGLWPRRRAPARAPGDAAAADPARRPRPRRAGAGGRRHHRGPHAGGPDRRCRSRPAVAGAGQPGAQRRPGDRARRCQRGRAVRDDRGGARGRHRHDPRHRQRPRPAGAGPAHLFEAFQGAGRSGGTGLGLAIAAELVRLNGGA